MLSDRFLRVVGCAHPDPLSLTISDAIIPENLYFNYLSDLRISKVESGLDNSKPKPPGSVRFVYNPYLALTTSNSKCAILNAIRWRTISYPDNLPYLSQYITPHMYFLLSPFASCGGKWVITIRVITFTEYLNWRIFTVQTWHVIKCGVWER